MSKRRIFDPWVLTQLVAAGTLLVTISGCGQDSAGPLAIRLIDQFATAEVSGQPTEIEPVEPIQWSAEELSQWKAVSDISGLRTEEGRLKGASRGPQPLIYLNREPNQANDTLHSLEIRMSTTAGSEVGVMMTGAADFDLDRMLQRVRGLGSSGWTLRGPLISDGKMHTYTLRSSSSVFITSIPTSEWRQILIRPSDEPEAEFEIESIRLISRKEHLQNVPSGLGWHGFGDIFRESLVSRAPEEIRFDLELPDNPWLDLDVATLEEGATTFRVEADAGQGWQTLLSRTVTTPHQWEEASVDLSSWNGQSVALRLSLQGDPGRLGFWGAPVIRSRLPERSASRSDRPQGVILIVGDTLRRDHLDAYGYQRPTAPVLARMASEGVLFRDNQSQATWTKVSVPSILTSLYPTTHGIRDIVDRLPASADTAAEIFREAGYATWASSSVPFTGQLSNLHQGVEVLHERNSVGDAGSKTARVLVDRLVGWVERHQDVPFFAFLHVFDPHSPFQPRSPYDAMWASPERKKVFDEQTERVKEHIKNPFMKTRGLPTAEELTAAGVESEPFVQFEKDWYDGSIRGMDAEIGRLLERLENLGLKENTVVAFVSDHGEEFLDHGQHWHGNNVYGEMLNVPMILYAPGRVAGGKVIDETVRSIDLLPTLLDLAGLSAPDSLQGRSLRALIEGPANDWETLPAFAERFRIASEPALPFEKDSDSFAVILDGWKLIHNVRRHDGTPEFELYDHRADPLDQNDVAEKHPEIVDRLSQRIEQWQQMALAAKLSDDEDVSNLSQQELERLRSLGYIQ